PVTLLPDGSSARVSGQEPPGYLNASEPLPMTRPTGAAADAIIEQINAAAYRIPLEQPHADGTLSWSAVTLVVVHLHAGDHTGLGDTYAPAGAARVIDDTLGAAVAGAPAMDSGASCRAMAHAVRNHGLSGPAAAAISAVDVAMWDLKARLLGVALAHLLQGYRPAGQWWFHQSEPRAAGRPTDRLGATGFGRGQNQSRHRPYSRSQTSSICPAHHRRRHRVIC